MRHLVIALVIGVITIAISVFFLSETDEAYVDESEPNRVIAMGDSYPGDNYTLVPMEFTCEEFPAEEPSDSTEGCVLSVELTNTTSFEQIFNLDGDAVIAKDGTTFESSDTLSRSLVEDNGLAQEVEADETVSGGVFFEMPVDTDVDRVEVYESVNTDPIVIEL